MPLAPRRERTFEANRDAPRRQRPLVSCRRDGREERVELFTQQRLRNLQCYFCIESERINSRSFMPWETIGEAPEENAARGVQLIQFMGGEATIHPRFVDALRLCRELGMRTFVILNLLRWARMDFAEEVTGLLDEVMISLHAFGDERGTHITGHSSWWRLFNTAFDNFLEHRGEERVRIATVMSRSNVDDLEKMAALLVRARPERWISGQRGAHRRHPDSQRGRGTAALRATGTPT
ncbi:MAG: radical SAM protein [Sandaracinaceae bacterium]|nr:radical SAM protein [Sandaracinaceae bacterium]